MRPIGRKIVAVAALSCLALAAACGSSSEAGGKDGTVALLIPGTTGDGGFFDNSKTGTVSGAKQVGWKAQVVEAGYEPTKWQPALDDLVGGNANPVITGTFAMTELVEQAAAEHPEKDFVLFDAAIDPKKCGGCKNVYSITYRYDESGFLAGTLAALLETKGKVDKVEGAKVVGVVGGQDIGVIKDYIKGFELGVKAVAPEVKVLSAFANSFSDPVQGKAVAEDMISQGADVLFTAAGGTDNGVFEAAAAHDLWAIGNSEEQAADGKVGGKDTILTASGTDVAASIKTAVVAASNGKLRVGKEDAFGVKDGTVFIVDSPLYKTAVPQEIRDQMTAITADLAAGKYDSLLLGK